MKRFLSILVGILIPIYVNAQVYLGVTGDFGNKIFVASDGRIQNQIGASLGMNIFMDTKIKNSFYVKCGLSSGFVNSKVVIPEFEDFETIPIGLFHISSNLAFGKRFTIGEQGFIDFYAGGGLSFYAGDDVGGKYGPSSSSSVVFQFSTYRTDNKPKGFAELLIQTKVNRVMLVGLRYQQHFSRVLEGTYLYYGDNQPSMAGSLFLIPACVSLQVGFKVTTLRVGK